MVNNELSYDNGWGQLWSDCMVYGPSRRHQQRIIKKCLENVEFNSVLEVGCGNGMNLMNVVRSYSPSNYAGLDISNEALKRVESILPGGSFFKIDIEKKYLGTKYDMILCCDTLEHLKDDSACLRNISRMSGRFVLVSTLTGKMRKSEKEVGHVRNYTKDNLISKLKAAGLEPIKVVNWGFPFFSPLHRSLLDIFPQKINYGEFGLFRKLISNILYIVFFFNFRGWGDYIFVLSKKV